MATSKQQCEKLTTYYEKLFKAKYGRKSGINRYAARWGFDAVLGSMTVQEAQKLLDYYFTTASSREHSIDWFFYNYDKLERAEIESERDAHERAKLREESAKRAAEWRKKVGDKGIIGN